MIDVAYAEKQTNTSVTATSEAAATTIVTAQPIYSDGVSPVVVEFGCNAWGQTATSPVNRLVLYDDDQVTNTAIGVLFQGVSPSTSTGKPGFTARRRYVPAQGLHVFSVRGWVSSASTWTVAGDVFGAGIDSPAYIRVTRVDPLAQAMYDAESRLDFTSSNSWTHTPITSNPRAVVVCVMQNTGGDVITDITYGGVAMTRVPTDGLAVDATGEPGVSYMYTLLSGVPVGPQTVAVTVSSGTTAKRGHAFTISANNDCRIAASGKIEADTANPSVTLSTGEAFKGFVVNALFSGHSSPASLTPGAGYDVIGRDYGSQVCAVEYGHKTGASVASGWTSLSEDVAMTVVAIEQIPQAFVHSPRPMIRNL